MNTNKETRQIPAYCMQTDSEEQALLEVIRAARTVQDFLWGQPNGDWGVEEWLRMFRKRVAKLEEVDRTNPHAAVEFRKRLLQTAALAVAFMAVIEKRGVPWEPSSVASNLPGYDKPVTVTNEHEKGL